MLKLRPYTTASIALRSLCGDDTSFPPGQTAAVVNACQSNPGVVVKEMASCFEPDTGVQQLSVTATMELKVLKAFRCLECKHQSIL